mmetsp:Transcript_69385/g.178836  ORF Transcript_69385/g.178836 Transcript_69385/m.178836 type:complete len:272 (-) Transcript_69385:291-1106(-)
MAAGLARHVARQQREPVGFRIGLHGLEGKRYVHVLQDALVIVPYCKRRHSLGVEKIVLAGVANVVDRGGNQAHKVVQLRGAVANVLRAHQPLRCRCDVDRMHGAVIGHVTPVQVVQLFEEAEERLLEGSVTRHAALVLEVSDQAVLLHQVRAQDRDGQSTALRSWVLGQGQRVEVEMPSAFQDPRHVCVGHHPVDVLEALLYARSAIESRRPRAHCPELMVALRRVDILVSEGPQQPLSRLRVPVITLRLQQRLRGTAGRSEPHPGKLQLC